MTKHPSVQSHEYRSFCRDQEIYLKKSLARLALFTDRERIRTPKECRKALKEIDESLLFEQQLEVLIEYAYKELIDND